MVILVNTIYRIRESLQWDQEKMADEMKVTVATVKRWENEDGIPGKAAQEKLISICQKEKIDLAEVVEKSENRHRKLRKVIRIEKFCFMVLSWD